MIAAVFRPTFFLALSIEAIPFDIGGIKTGILFSAQIVRVAAAKLRALKAHNVLAQLHASIWRGCCECKNRDQICSMATAAPC